MSSTYPTSLMVCISYTLSNSVLSLLANSSSIHTQLFLFPIYIINICYICIYANWWGGTWKKIVISKVDFVCDIIDESIPLPLPQNYNHFSILSAPPRSGKSTWIMNCLCKSGKVYNKKFDLVYIVSPSLKTAKDDPFECLPPDQIESELTLDFIDRFVNNVSESGKRVLLLLDDVVNDIRKK
jgi:hypothetical protein